MADAPLNCSGWRIPLCTPISCLLSGCPRPRSPLLAALIRQESLFEPAAESYAGARGLGQVMPATGTGIANSLGMEDFVLDDLYRPHISIMFGAFYLRAQMDRFDNQILVALAGYNGGPGNTLRWIEAGGEDLDLFVEVITATQSRLYLQRVYEQYLIYERLYRTTGRWSHSLCRRESAGPGLGGIGLLSHLCHRWPHRHGYGGQRMAAAGQCQAPAHSVGRRSDFPCPAGGLVVLFIGSQRTVAYQEWALGASPSSLSCGPS